MKNTTLKVAAYTILAVIFLTWLSRSTRKRKPKKIEVVKLTGESYLHQASTWAAAAESENNALLSLLHINYAIVCANIGRSLDDTHLREGEFIDFIRRCELLQATRVKALTMKCPALRKDLKLAQIAGWL